jgi:hypothetical protein
VAVRSVTRVFSTYQEARDAIQALEAAGVKPRAISILTRSPKDTEELEHDTGASDDLDDAVHRNRLAQFLDWLGKVESATVPGFGALLGTGNLWQDVSVAGSGRGSITGALVGSGVPVDEAEALEQDVFGGRILVVIQGTYDAAMIDRILQTRATPP